MCVSINGRDVRKFILQNNHKHKILIGTQKILEKRNKLFLSISLHYLLVLLFYHLNQLRNKYYS